MDFSYMPPPGSSAVIDNSAAHSGSNSVRISISDPAAPHFIFKELPTGLTNLYVRAWLYTPVQLGGNSQGSAGDHAHFIGTFEVPGSDNGIDLRFGLNQKSFFGGFIAKLNDAFTLEESAATIPANQWTCVEWGLESAEFDRMYGWIGGESVLAAVTGEDWANGDPSEFITDTSTAFVSFGWRQFGSVASVDSIWFDDIAVGTDRIGCD